MAEKIAVQEERPPQVNHDAAAKPAKKTSRSRTGNAKTTPAISVIIPIHNMARDVQALHKALASGLENRGQAYEIVFVDDASTDTTWKELEALAAEHGQIRLIRMRNTFGESSAFDAGLKHSQGELIVYAAARVRANLAKVDTMLQRLDDGADLVVGWRWPRKDSDLNQRISRWFNTIVQKISKLALHDMNSSVFVTRRSMLSEITFYGNLNIFLPILASKKGYRVVEEKIDQLPGEFRQSKYVGDYIKRSLDIIAVIFLTKYSKRPLHFLGFFGMVFSVSGLLINLYLFGYRIMGFGGIAGRPLLLLGALLLVIGLQMISIGLIGEMIIYTHAREIKEYNIDRVIGE